MSHIAIAHLIIAGRIVSGCIGFLALYVAFFLYEDKENEIQNRLEEMWVGIHERARLRGNTAVALLNSAGVKMDSLMNRCFGKKLFSGVALYSSLSLSSAGAGIALLYKFNRTFPSRDEGLLFSFFATYCYLYYTIYKTEENNKKVTVAKLFFMLLCFVIAGTLAFLFVSPDPTYIWVVGKEPWFLATFTLSFLSDILVIILIRNVSRFLCSSVSLSRLLAAFFALTLVPCISAVAYGVGDGRRGGQIGSVLFYVGLLNITTSVFSLIPALFVIALLLHFIAWPLLSKLLYPLPRHGVVGSRKTLSAVGVLALTFAFNLEHVDFLKLVSVAK